MGSTTIEVIPPRSGRGATDHAARLLGIIGVIGSPGLFVVWLTGGFGNADATQGAVAAQLVFLIGWACSLVGLHLVRAAGHGKAHVLIPIQLIGVTIAMTQELQDLLLPAPDRAALMYQMADAAWPLSVVFMIVTGVTIARARVLAGWRRFAGIACGLTLPAAIAIAAIAGESAMGPAFGVLTMGAWGVLGYTVATASPTGMADVNLDQGRES